MEDFFLKLADEFPRWNFVFVHNETYRGKILSGIWITIYISIVAVGCSIVIGVAGAWLQGSKQRVARALVQGYIQFFRNTPPVVQLLFFYLALGQFTPTTSPDGWLEVPIISNIGWAIVSLSFFAGAFNVEIFRAGIEAVPESTKEAAESLGYSRLQTYQHIVLPLAFRVSLPALNNNLVNLVKTTSQALVIAVPEFFYQITITYNDYPSAMYPSMLLAFVFYNLLVGILVFGMNRWERNLTIPGYGQG